MVYQEVLPSIELDFKYYVCVWKKTDDELVAEIAKKFVRLPISLENGPLVRFALYQTDDNVFYFILVGHHIVYDGSSENIFCRELSSEYDAIINNRESSIATPEISYGDYML